MNTTSFTNPSPRTVNNPWLRHISQLKERSPSNPSCMSPRPPPMTCSPTTARNWNPSRYLRASIFFFKTKSKQKHLLSCKIYAKCYKHFLVMKLMKSYCFLFKKLLEKWNYKVSEVAKLIQLKYSLCLIFFRCTSEEFSSLMTLKTWCPNTSALSREL